MADQSATAMDAFRSERRPWHAPVVIQAEEIKTAEDNTGIITDTTHKSES